MSEATRDNPAVEKYARHVNPAFVKLLGMLRYGRLLTHAKDVWIRDHEGREYLDLLAGFGSVNVGHNHPRLTARLKAFLDEDALNFVHVGPASYAADLAERLAAIAGPPLEVAAFANTGSEAVEAGMKLARFATGRDGFLSLEGGFHGLSFGALSVSGEEELKREFGALVPGCDRVPAGDLAALERALATRRYAGLIVDPLQCEWAAAPLPHGYLARAQELARVHGTLMVLDEVQTGLGRTGSWFAFQQEGFVPDVLVLAKALGGGLAPIGIALTSRAIHDRVFTTMDRFGIHGSTFAAGSLACVVALETIAIIQDQGLLENARARGDELRRGLATRLAGHPLVKRIGGRGLLVSVELGPTESGALNRIAPGMVEAVARGVFGQWASVRLLEAGVICQPATRRWNVLKIEPPLTFAPAHVERTISAFEQVLGAYQGLTPLIKDVTQRLGQQFLAGWAF